jgi:hypothetical protein
MRYLIWHLFCSNSNGEFIDHGGTTMNADSEPPPQLSGEAHEAEARLKVPDLQLDPQRYRESAEEAIKLAMRMLHEARRMRTKAAKMNAAAAQTREYFRLERIAQRQCFLSGYSTPMVSFLDPHFLAASDLGAILATAVDAALQLTGADMGNVQLFDPAIGRLQIEAQHGFERPFLEFFENVHEGQAACGRALALAERVIVEDVTKSPIFVGTPGLDVMLEARARAVQSIPLIGSSGRLLGVLSTHYHRPQCSTESELRLLDLLARVAARWIERKSTPTLIQSRCR